MASSADLRDIMGLAGPSTAGEITKEMILASVADKPKKSGRKSEGPKRPEGMARELYNLLYSDSKDAPPIIPTDTNLGKDMGYKQMKAKLGMRRVRPWKWMPFTNPARRDGLVLYHWRRQADEGKEYAFSRFNKTLEMPTFSDVEYQNHLTAEGWSRAETEHLLDLCGRFDLRFPVVHDRWDRDTHKTPRSLEDLKERYYGIVEKLETLHADPSKAASKPFAYDADHERRRKEQLLRLYDRTKEQVEEEDLLRAELKKIEARKRDRERKTQDLQKLIMQATDNSDKVSALAPKLSSSSFYDKRSKKKLPPHHTSKHRHHDQGSLGGSGLLSIAATGAAAAAAAAAGSSLGTSGSSSLRDLCSIETAGIKFPDFRTSGVTLRSSRMRLPQNLGTKKTKAVEQMLQEVGLEPNPIPTAEICNDFNDLRSDMVLLYDLKSALATCEQEIQSLKGQYDALRSSNSASLEIPELLRLSSVTAAAAGSNGKSATTPRRVSDVIDVLNNGPTPPVRKRKAALEQSNVLKKIKNKNF